MQNGTTPALTPAEQRTANPERLVFLTDGVIAIIITILVLEIKVPELGSGQSLADSLTEIRPTFVAFVISFLIVGVYWTLHRQTFSQVRYIDHNALWLNLLFLMVLALVPFASSAIGEYPTEPTALHIYGAVLIAASLLRLALNAYFENHRGSMWQEESKRSRRLTSGTSFTLMIVYVVAMVVAGWSTTLSLILYFSVPVFYFVIGTLLKTDSGTKDAADDLG